jgi:hypothetical protein
LQQMLSKISPHHVRFFSITLDIRLYKSKVLYFFILPFVLKKENSYKFILWSSWFCSLSQY